MSYDLTLIHIPEGADPSSVYQQFVENEERHAADLDAWMKRPISPEAREEMRRIADELKSWRPALEEFQPESPLPWIELNDDALMIQFNISEGSVGVTIPYFGENAEEVMGCVAGCFDTLANAAAYRAYDPQLGRFVTSNDLNEMVTHYRRVNGAFPEVMAWNPEAANGRKKPWWKFW